MKYSKSLIVILVLNLFPFFNLTVNANHSETVTDTETVTYNGRLEVGKTKSVILYLGSETGDLAAFCFLNKSAVGRAILSKCKPGKECEFTGKVNWDKSCDVKRIYPGGKDLQQLSASAEIISVKSVRRR